MLKKNIFCVLSLSIVMLTFILPVKPVYADTIYNDTEVSDDAASYTYTIEETQTLLNTLKKDSTAKTAYLAYTLAMSHRFTEDDLTLLFQNGYLREHIDEFKSEGIVSSDYTLPAYSGVEHTLEILSSNEISTETLPKGNTFTELNDTAEQAFAQMTSNSIDNNTNVTINTLASATDKSINDYYLNYTGLNGCIGYINFMNDDMDTVLYAWKFDNWKGNTNNDISLGITYDENKIVFSANTTLEHPVTVWIKMNDKNMNYNIFDQNNKLITTSMSDENGYISFSTDNCTKYRLTKGSSNSKSKIAFSFNNLSNKGYSFKNIGAILQKNITYFYFGIAAFLIILAIIFGLKAIRR